VAQSTEADPPEPEPGPPPADSRWGGAKTALAAALALAATLRLVGIRHGLPHPGLVDPGERGVVEHAWRMSHGGGFDPRTFRTPPGFLELLAAIEAPFAHPSLLAARLLVAALAVGAVAATWWLASTYGLVAGAVAAVAMAVETAHVAHAHAGTPAVAVTLGVAVSLALAVRGRLLWAAAAAGVAVALGYAALLLVVPLAILGWRRWRALAIAGGLLVASFLLVSPFVVVQPGQFARDGWHVGRSVTHSRFGYEHDHFAAIAYLAHLWHGLGPVLLVALLGLGLALAQRRQRADLLLPAFAIAVFLGLLLTRAHPDRYTLALVPALAALAARVRYLASVTLLLLIVPLTWSVRADVKLTRTDTRVAALTWIAAHVPPGATLVEDPGLPRATGLRVVPRPLGGAVVVGAAAVYVLVDGAVADRVAAARDRYPRDAAFYARLARRKPLFRLDGKPPFSGPWIAVYRLYPS
jgi:hypothetical protein